MTDTEALLRAALPELEAMQAFIRKCGHPDDAFDAFIDEIREHIAALDARRASTLDDEGTPV
mgnify:CR=1 FL=1